MFVNRWLCLIYLFLRFRIIYIYIYILQHRATGGSWSITTAVVKICHRHSPTQHLKWDNHIESIVNKAQQRFYFLHQLRKFKLPQDLLKQFYSAIIVSVLCTSVTVWFSSATKSDLRRLRRVVRTAERIIGTPLPTLQELYLSRVRKGLEKPLQTPHIQHTPSLNCYRLVDATELWASEWTDTDSLPKQSISWTLDI